MDQDFSSNFCLFMKLFGETKEKSIDTLAPNVKTLCRISHEAFFCRISHEAFFFSFLMKRFFHCESRQPVASFDIDMFKCWG